MRDGDWFTPCRPIVYGPVKEGERTISGDTYPMSGYGWACSCGASGFGFETEDDAETYVDRHIELRQANRGL